MNRSHGLISFFEHSFEKLVYAGSNELRKARVKTVSLSECNTTYLQYNQEANNDAFENGISKGQYCARDPDGRMDSCRGDSGK